MIVMEKTEGSSLLLIKGLSASFQDITNTQGSDPRLATCRGRLQSRRSKLNQEINKELRLRAGAENLFKATTNRKLRETVALELSFVNSNLQLLKQELAELNSCVELYQNNTTDQIMPMIPLGLKETNEIDFREPFKDFILEHYSEDSAKYEEAITEFMDIRQSMRFPLRDNTGVTLLFKYFNHLYFVERRFFPPDRSLGIYFEWYDSLTGVPSCQRTVAFEKACVLFNIGAIYTQIGTKQDRRTTKGLDYAVDSFLRAAGTFKYIQENYTNAPSMDLGPEMLEMLIQLMLAQARECLLEKLELQSKDKRTTDISLDLAQEASYLAHCYNHVHHTITQQTVKNYVPYSWVSLLQLKHVYFTAMAHYHVACGLFQQDTKDMSSTTKDILYFLHMESSSTQMNIRSPRDELEKNMLGKAHLRQSLLLHEECQRIQKICRELKGKQALIYVLKNSQNMVLQKYTSNEFENDFRDTLDPPNIQASTKFQLSITTPDFSLYKVQDLFRNLGPIAIFSAKKHWTVPRQVQLQKDEEHNEFGFSIRGNCPIIISHVEKNSLAEAAGVKEGDFIVEINDKDVKWAAHDEVVTLIKEHEASLSLRLVTPTDRNYLKPYIKLSKESIATFCNGSLTSSIKSNPPAQRTSSKRNSWNPFKKTLTLQDEKDFFQNIILK